MRELFLGTSDLISFWAMNELMGFAGSPETAGKYGSAREEWVELICEPRMDVTELIHGMGNLRYRQV